MHHSSAHDRMICDSSWDPRKAVLLNNESNVFYVYIDLELQLYNYRTRLFIERAIPPLKVFLRNEVMTRAIHRGHHHNWYRNQR